MADIGMRLVRFGDRGLERPGILEANGVLRDLSGTVPDWDPSTLSNAVLRQIAALDPASLPFVPGRPRLGVPVAGISKFLAIGLNYADLAQAMGRELPSEPVLFTKAVSCLTGPDDPIVLPRGSTHTDWEVELGVVIGTTARYVEEKDALNHVAGYCLVNDLSEREYQNNRGGTWDKGKGCDTFGPTGPWLVTRDELIDPQDVELWLEVNGVRWQDGHTGTMIFHIAKLVSYLSEFMTLEPGDLIATGTPPGFGASANPPVFLCDGDKVRLGSSKLGIQQHLVTAWRTA
jgi:2-keto-4-pentenoate hydratase/2-oxohepta-3-ene-1,7-dioic acid hydratase in catechol pathway